MKQMIITPGTLTLEHLPDFLENTIIISEQANKRVQAAYDYVQTVIKANQLVYGINTGFGKLATQRVSLSDLMTLQKNLILSHAVGTGEYLPDDIVSLILLLKINMLSAGYSGVSVTLLDRLLIMYNQKIYPKIPAKGSVGASGDLAPLAHMACTLIGVGACRYQAQEIEATAVWRQLDLEPIRLGPKEGLALINGTQVSTAIAVSALLKTRRLFEAALITGALSVDAALGSDTPFMPEIQEVRGQIGQTRVATCLLTLLADSEIRKSHVAHCQKVQDPYSLRCQPQVMGAIWDQLQYARAVLEREMNAITDNPLVFFEKKQILSGGNFRAESVAFAADAIAIAIAEIGAIAERRIALLLDEHLSGLPAFLIQAAGLNSGLMIAQVTAAALVSENKTQCFPNSVDSLPTSANQEDHVSMATHAAWRLHRMLDNLGGILAIELIIACQGLDFRKPLKTSPSLEPYYHKLREYVSFITHDEWLSPSIELVKKLIFQGVFSFNDGDTLNSKVFWNL